VLRAIDERKVMPVGATRALPIDVRIVAATHRDLPGYVADGRFRQDLYYRLAVLRIDVPPLRERRDDIVPLAEHFLAELSDMPRALTPAAVVMLEGHDWPGNARELRNAIERAIVMSRASVLDAADLHLAEPARSDRADALPEQLGLKLGDAIAGLEARMIREALRNANGNRAEAARRLGIRRQLLYTKMREHGIES
jgi:two-component system NtrC family response regulator